jgi:uncharacterized protein
MSAQPPSAEPANLVLRPRDVRFDWSALPVYWIPGEPYPTHYINSLHLLLPEGERWFVRVFTQALPLIRDDRLRDDVLGFIGQEAMHASSHQGVVDHFTAHGIDPTPFVNQLEWMFSRLLGDRDLTGHRARQWLIERLALIAAIEHFTAMLGQWILDARALDEAGADPTMLDLLRWHGAEEVEHRSVAFDLFSHVDGGYLRRARTMLVAWFMISWLLLRGGRFLVASDPALRGLPRHTVRDLRRITARGLLPRASALLRWTLRYFRPTYHPSQDCSTSTAVAYLATSPAARAAQR